MHQSDAIVVVDEDEIMQRSYVDAVALRFPKEFALISQVIAKENIYHALREKDVLFKKTAMSAECAKAMKTLLAIQEELNKPENISWKLDVSRGIDLEVLKNIRAAFVLNKPVLLDSWYIKPKHLKEHFPESKVIRVLLYCPLSIAYERLIKRNKEAELKENLQEKRYLRQLAGSFFSMYQLTKEPCQMNQKVSKIGLNTVLNTMSSALVDRGLDYVKPVFTFDEVPSELFLQLKNEFLRPFENYGAEELYISPKDEQDIIVDTSQEDLQKSIQRLNKVFLKKD